MYTLGMFDNPDLRYPQVVNELVMAGGADEAPLLTFLTQQNRRTKVKGDKYSWNTLSLDKRRTQVDNGGAAYDATTTAIVVDAGTASLFYKGCQVYCEATGEILHVSAVNTATHTLTVIRGIGSTTGGVAAHANSVANNAFLLVIGNARGEATGAPASRDQVESKVENYTQLMKRAIETSNKVNAGDLQVGDKRLNDRKREFENTTRDMEHMLTHGVRAVYTDVDGKRVTSSGGALQFITTNIDNVGGNITANRWEQAFYQAGSKGSREKIAIFGGLAMRSFRAHWRSQIQLRPDDTRIGMGWEEIDLGYLKLKLRISRSFVGPMDGSVLIIDPEHAAIVDFEGRELVLEQDLQPNDADYTQDQWKGEHGGYWGDESCHMLIKGIQGAV